MADMHYCGKCGACRPDCEVLRNQHVCLACCHDDIGWWQNRFRKECARVAELEAEVEMLRTERAYGRWMNEVLNRPALRGKDGE